MAVPPLVVHAPKPGWGRCLHLLTLLLQLAAVCVVAAAKSKQGVMLRV